MTGEVVAALEAAERGSRKLDALMATTLGYRVEWHINPATPDGEPREPVHLTPWGGTTVPAYTTSLDAALTLVPEGWSVSHAWWDSARASFTLKRHQGEWPQGEAPTPALALCIAALKARTPGIPHA